MLCHECLPKGMARSAVALCRFRYVGFIESTPNGALSDSTYGPTEEPRAGKGVHAASFRVCGALQESRAASGAVVTISQPQVML